MLDLSPRSTGFPAVLLFRRSAWDVDADAGHAASGIDLADVTPDKSAAHAPLRAPAVALARRQSGAIGEALRPDPLWSFMAGVRLRDEAALEGLYGACSSRVFACAIGVVTRHDLAEDVVSACFLQAWRCAEDYDPERATVIAWLRTIARSRALDLLRRLAVRHRHETTLEDEDLDAVADPAAGPPGQVALAQIRTRLLAAIGLLSPVQRQVLHLAFLDGLSHDEVAERTAMPLGTVKSHVRRGIAALRADPALIAIGL